MRSACLFALLDGLSTIGTTHLSAALALWRYEDASLRFLFGDSLGNPLADRLRMELLSVENSASLGLKSAISFDDTPRPPMLIGL